MSTDGLLQCAVFSDLLLSLSHAHRGFLHGLRAHFLLVLNNIPLSRRIAVYLFTHLLKDIFVASKIWQL